MQLTVPAQCVKNTISETYVLVFYFRYMAFHSLKIKITRRQNFPSIWGDKKKFSWSFTKFSEQNKVDSCFRSPSLISMSKYSRGGMCQSPRQRQMEVAIPCSHASLYFSQSNITYKLVYVLNLLFSAVSPLIFLTTPNNPPDQFHCIISPLKIFYRTS